MTVHERNIAASIDPVKLDRLAEVAIKVGLNLQAGTGPAADGARGGAAAGAQDRRTCLQGRGRPGDADPVRRGGHAVALPVRPDDSFDRAAGWLYEGMSKAFAANTARLAIVGDDPMLLSGEDPAKVARASKANSVAYQPALEKIVNFDVNWNIIAYPSPSWAKQVFPDDEEDVAVAKLADAIFAASRVDNDDAVAAWAKHNATLREQDRMAERPALQRAALFRTRHRPDDRARRRP